MCDLLLIFTNDDAEELIKIFGRIQDHKDLEGCRCPRCRNELQMPMVRNSLSRYVDAYICNDCGVDEAFNGHTSFSQWKIITDIAEAYGER